MLFLVDDDMGPHIAAALRALQHEAVLVREVLGPHAHDADICAHAESIGAAVVTRNLIHYSKRLQRRQEAPRRFRKAGLLAVVNMVHTRAAQRLKMFDSLVRHELQQVSGSSDARILIELHKDRVIVLR